MLEVALIVTLLTTGLNRRLADPSMTDLVTLGAAAVILFAADHATPHGRSVILYFLPLSFVFAAFRHSSSRLIILLTIVLLFLAGETALRWLSAESSEQLFREIEPDTTAVAIALVTLAAVGSQSNNLRRRICAERAASHLAMTRMSDAVIVIIKRNCSGNGEGILKVISWANRR